MLKNLLLATALISSNALAYDQADRDAPLGRLVAEPTRASLVQYVPRVVYVPAPSPEPVYQPPVQCDETPAPVVSQPAQTASLRLARP